VTVKLNNFGFHKIIKHLFTTLMRNVSPNQHIRMIPEDHVKLKTKVIVYFLSNKYSLDKLKRI